MFRRNPWDPPGPTCRKCMHLLDHNMKCTNKNCPNYQIGGSGGSGGSIGIGIVKLFVIILAVIVILFALSTFFD